MNHIDLEKMQEMIANSVRTTVNGKIGEIKVMLQNHIQNDDEWKKGAQPAIEIWTNVNGFGKVVAYIFGMVSGAAGLFWLIIHIVTSFKK